PNGTIVAAGTLQSDQQPTPRIALSRFDSVLGFDPTFPGADALGGPIGVSGDVLVQPNGAIVVAAALGDENSPRFALLRWTVDGAVDGGFGNAGVAIAFADRPGAAQRLVRQPDGKLLAAGLLPTGASGPLVLARFLADGTTSTTGAPATTTTTMTGTT